MIKADIQELEKLTDVVLRLASDADETCHRLRQLSFEMDEDVELAVYPQAPVALEAVTAARAALDRANDTTQALRHVVFSVADHYRETERQHREALGRLTDRLDTVSAGYTAAVVSPHVARMEHTDEGLSHSKVRQLVADSAQELQVANIAAVSGAVREEYAVTDIRDLAETT